jgi:ligand-binding sensor domain-containing protein
VKLSKNRLGIITLILSLCHTMVFSQFYPAKVYSLQEGMPTNSIYDITQSKDGIMWFVTAKGVVNYNALNWQVFPDSLELPSTPFSFIRSCDDGSVWVAGQNSTSFIIKYFHDNNWQEIALPQLANIQGKFSFDVKKDSQAYSIIICDSNTAYTYNTKTKELKSTVVSERDNFRINAVNFKNDKVFLATNEGLYSGQDGILPQQLNVLIKGDKEILQIHWQGDDLLLLGLGWLGKYKNDEFSYLSTHTGIKTSSPYNKHNLTTDQLGRIFYSSNSGANYFDNESETGKTLYVNGRVFNVLSNKIFVDRENNVWVGDHRGLFKFNVLRFENYNENTGLAKDEVTSILQLDDALILANANYLNILKNGSIVKKVAIVSDPGARILDMVHDESGKIYLAAGSSGLMMYDSQGIKSINWKNSPGEIGVASVGMFKDSLFFTSNKALYIMKRDRVHKIMNIASIRNLQCLPGDSIIALSTHKGLIFYNPLKGDTTSFVSTNRKYNNTYGVTSWNGNHYVGTAGGLAVIKNGEITPINLGEKLNRVAIYSLLVSSKNRLWLGTNEGVFIWDGTTLTNYNKSDGLVGDEVNRNAMIEDSYGNIWIGTEMGASVYTYDEDKSFKIKPQLVLDNPYTQKGTVIKDQNQALQHDDNTIAFDFLGISFFDEKQITYRYKLKGFDNDWIIINNPNSNAVRYTNLAPGDYEFTVESGIAGNNYSAPESIEFSINEPFYASTWFTFLTIISLSLLLYMIYRIRFYVILKNQKKLQREVIASTQEIQEMNKEIQAQNEELTTQSEEIVSTNEMLEITVYERTRQLREQNKKLAEYAFINSHQLRAPICRMIGLLNLLPITKKEEQNMILQLIHQTGVELDQISKDINNLLDQVDFSQLEEINSIEIINAEIKDRPSNPHE